MTKSRTLADSGTAFTSVSATELGYVDGVTSAIQTQIDGKQAVNANVSTTELGYLDGVTSAIQTQLDAKTAKATLTTTGDIYYASSASTPARLGIGSSAQVLTVAGGVPSWATPTATAKSYSLIGTGTLTGATTVTVSGISGINTIYIEIASASAAAGNDFGLRINTDTTSKYSRHGVANSWSSTYARTIADVYNQINAAQFYFCSMPSGGTGTAAASGGIVIDGCNSSGLKMIQTMVGITAGDSTGNLAQQWLTGNYSGTSTVSSVSLVSDANWDAGTYYVYGSA